MRKAIGLVVPIATLALMAAACRAQDASPTSTSAATSTTSAPPTTTTGAPDPTGTQDTVAELMALLTEAAAAPMRATYAVRDGGDVATVTLSRDPTQDPPLEAVFVPEADAKLITTGGESIFCDTKAQQCFSMVGGLGADALGAVPRGLFLAAGVYDIQDAEISGSEEMIAGRVGRCFTFTPATDTTNGTTTVRQCIDADLGFTLIVQTSSSAGEFETIMELIELGEPLTDDFIPSGPVSASP